MLLKNHPFIGTSRATADYHRWHAPHHIIEKEYYDVKERTIIVTTVNDEYLKL
jgi:hypothetical protein